VSRVRYSRSRHRGESREPVALVVDCLAPEDQSVSCASGALLGLPLVAGRQRKGFRRPVAVELLFFACPKKSSQKKGHPAAAPSGHPALRVRVGLPGFAGGTSVCLQRTGAPPARHRCATDPPARRRDRGAPLAAILAATARFDESRGGASFQAIGRGASKRFLQEPFPAWVPYLAPSSAGSRRGKARMSEAMDGRVRAGRRVPSNAGHRPSAAWPVRDPGRLSFGYFSLAKQRKVARAGRRPDRNAIALARTAESIALHP